MFHDNSGPRSQTYYSQRLRLHYLDWGNPTKPKVLLIHGIQDHCHNWDWTSEILKQDYHVITPDLRGHGDSEWSRGSAYNHLDYVYDIAQLVDQRGLSPCHIVGHSMGGTVASIFASLFPEKTLSLTSVEGVGIYWQHSRQTGQLSGMLKQWAENTRSLAGRIPKRYPDFSSALKRLMTSNPHLSEARAQHLTSHGTNQNEDGSFSWKFDNYTHSQPSTGLFSSDLIELWDGISCPALLLNAKQGFEHRIGQDGTSKHFNNLVTLDIDQAGHWLHHDQFEQFIANLKSFLASSA